MGRPKRVITSKGPAAEFAAELRKARIDADMPTYREMGKIGGWSHNGLSEADRGEKLPTWKCTHAYLKGCGVADKDIHTVWRPKWNAANREVNLQAEAELASPDRELV